MKWAEHFLITIIIGSLIFLTYFSYQVIQSSSAYQNDSSKLNRVFDYHFVLIAPDLSDPYWSRIFKGANQAAQEKNILLEIVGANGPDLHAYEDLLNKYIHLKVDGIITFGLPTDRFLLLTSEAKRLSIPLITIDTDAPKSERLAYVGTYNYMAGRQAGEALCRLINSSGKIGIISGNGELPSQKDRVQGILDALHQSPGVNVIDIRLTQGSRLEAQIEAERMLKEHPDIQAMIGTSTMDGPGIVEALDRLGITRRVHIVTFDDMPETLQSLEKGDIDVVISQNPELMGYLSIHILIKSLKGIMVPTLNQTDTRVLWAR